VADTKDDKQQGGKSAKAGKPGKAEQSDPKAGASATSEAARTSTPVAIGGDSLVDRLLPHVKKIAVGAAAIAVVLTVYFTWSWRQERKAAKATASLSDALALLRRPVVPPPAKDKEGEAPPPSTEPSFPTYKEKYETTVAALAKTGDAEKPARLLEARLLLSAGKVDEAEAIYKRVSTGTSLDAVLAREGLGYVAEARAAAAKEPAERQRLLEAALAAFRTMQPNDKGPRRDYALYHEARILAQLDKGADARAALEKALELVPDSEIEIDIQQRLAQLDATAAP